MTNTTPTTTTYSLNAGQLITRAYRILGILPSGGVPTADQFEQGLIALNFMLKGWQADGINLYRQEQLTLIVGPMQGTPGNPISITPLILGFSEGRWVTGTNPLTERPMGIFSYIDYQTLPNKMASSTSGPSIVMFDKQENASNLYIWPPATFGGKINCTVGRSVIDVTQPSDTLDFPVEWTEGAIYNLADRLMDDEAVAANDPATAQRITERAVAFYTKLLNFDRPTSVFIRPWGKKGTGKMWR